MRNTLPKTSLYKPVSHLDTEYTFKFEDIEDASIPLEGLENHAVLYAAESEYRQIYNAQYSTSISKVNIATGRLTVLYSDTSLEEGYIGEDIYHSSFDLSVPANYDYTHTTKEFYRGTNVFMVENLSSNKALRSTEFNTNLQLRINAYLNLRLNFDTSTALTTITTTAALNQIILKGNFHETFHHSEQAMMALMDQDAWQKALIKQIQNLGDAVYIYGFVHDIFTTRCLCENCNIGLIGQANSRGQGFLGVLTGKLENAGFETRQNGLMLSTRVSCNEAAKGSSVARMQLANDVVAYHQIDPDRHGHIVMQALSSKLGVKQEVTAKKYTMNEYSGDFFTSREIRHSRTQGEIVARYE